MSTIMGKTTNDQTPILSSTPCAEDVFDAIHRLMHLYRSEQYLSPNASGLTPMQGKVLRFFANRPNSTLKELRVDFSKDQSHLAKLINGLKAMNLLKSQVDRRGGSCSKATSPTHSSLGGKRMQRFEDQRSLGAHCNRQSTLKGFDDPSTMKNPGLGAL